MINSQTSSTGCHSRDRAWQGWGKLGFRVADGIFPPALQMDGERRPEGQHCRTGAPKDRNPNLSGTWAGQQTSVELATNLIQEANSLSLHGLDDIYAKMVLVSLS